MIDSGQWLLKPIDPIHMTYNSIEHKEIIYLKCDQRKEQLTWM